MNAFPCPLRAAAKNWRDTAAIISESREISYAELDEQVGRMAAHMSQLGIKRGERVVVIGPNSLAAVVLLHATIRIGAVFVPLSFRFPAEQIESLIDTVRPSLVAIDQSLDLSINSSVDIEKLFSDSESQTEAIEIEQLHLDDNATIIATSGSTSLPKLAVHTLGNHVYNALGSNQNIKLEQDDRWLLSLPLFHVGGIAILFRCALSASTVVIDNSRDLMSSIIENKITHLSVVPTQLKRLMTDMPDMKKDKTGLKAVLVGGGPVSQGLMLQARTRGVPVHASYGLTEMASQVTTTAPNANEAELLTSGRLLPHRELMTAADNEILVRGKCLFKGYYQIDGSIKGTDGSWFHTGDLGLVNSAGLLVVRGRKDNMFISGGENIHPEEIESVMLSLDMIDDVIVVPVPDEDFLMRPAAFVRFGDEKLDYNELAVRLERKLPRFKIPDYFFDWPESESVSIKPSRTELTKKAARLI